MKNNDLKILGLFLLGVGVLLGLTYLNDEGRSSLIYDGDTAQDFELSLVRFDDEVKRGGLLDARLEITNKGAAGSMFVECGVYDRQTAQGSWVPRTAQVIELDQENNCQPGEEYVQTSQVFLKTNEKTVADFKLNVPLEYGDDVALHCTAFERCWSQEKPDTYKSDSLTEKIVLLPAEVVVEEEQLIVENDEVIIIDEAELSGSDARFKEWMRQNSLLFLGLVFLLMIVGGVLIYKEPKQKKGFDVS